jgi:hypothetical protein
MYTNPTLVGPIAAALLGAPIEGGTSLLAAMYSQRCKDRLQRIACEIATRESIYADLALLGAILAIAMKPRIELRQLANEALSKSLGPDPLRAFSEICRADLDLVCRVGV